MFLSVYILYEFPYNQMQMFAYSIEIKQLLSSIV